MKKTTAARIALASLALCVASAASVAADPDHTSPGTPGTPNCRGQTMAYVAQLSKNGIIPEGFRGIGGVSDFTGLTNQQINEIVRNYCG